MTTINVRETKAKTIEAKTLKIYMKVCDQFSAQLCDGNYILDSLAIFD